MCVEMCGPRDVALDSPTVTTASGEATGQDNSSSTGIFVLTVEHLHGGGGVLAFVLVLAFTLSLLWCCAKRRLPWCRVAERGSGGRVHKEDKDDEFGGKGGPGTTGWLPSLA